ncbi:MAG: FAD-dependent oxidoreductase [Christiangramia sp.]|uniref:NAD(P)/FAD-dependent oxidoreductase n=1 Tax=Christiangramia sp. TaxID=1931228 RepID=UPI0032422C53
MSKNCVIIGGGIIGLCTAYYLHKEGHHVQVLEKGNMDGGASYVNAGYITPSHIIPLSSPGIIAKGLKWMLNSRSPFYVKPRLNGQFLKWAWSFKKSANFPKVQKSVPVIRDINLLSRELYEDMKKAQEFPFAYERNGLLMCYQTSKSEQDETSIAEMAEREGMKVMHLTSENLQNQFPDAHYNVRGAWYYDCDAHMTPNEFMKQLKNYLLRSGVKIHTGTEVTNFNFSGDRISEVKSGDKKWQADEVILAAGSWSPVLARQLGLKILVEAGKGYSFNVYRDTGIKLPSILVEAKVAVTPMHGFTRFAGTMELGGINNIVNPVRVNAIADAAENYFSGLKISSAEKESVSTGLRPCSPDGLPYIGRSAKWKNLSIGTGHAMMGWSLGPATGKLISEIIDNQKPSLDLQPFQPERKF